jgi:hypothetical protein
MSTTDHTPRARHSGPTRRLGPVAGEASTGTRGPSGDAGAGQRIDGAAGALALGRYRLQRRLGAGGFGVVWRAHDTRLERDVAVKVLPRGEGEQERARIEREALAAARLNHPGIVALYELGSDEQSVYLVSELVDGATLQELVRERAVSDRDVARIGQAMCEALAHAHARGVVHRDVKPGNVMVLAEPAAGAGFAKLTDFGIAHLAAAGDELTATGDVLGTLAYMAPEQAEGARVTGASDVYALALSLYEAWTGSNPVRARSPAATARRLGTAIPALRSRRPDLPPALGELVDAALDVDPVYRPEPAELRACFEELAEELSDEGGLVEPETIERFGLTAVRPRTRLRTLLHRRAESPSAGESAAVVARARVGARVGAVTRLAPRLAAGAGAGVLMLAALATLGPTPPVAAPAAGLVAALIVAVLPRIGWICAALALCVWLASPGADQAGTALVLAAALAPVPVLLPRAGLLWSAPALAPLLGAVALAPAFVGAAAVAVRLGLRRGFGAVRAGGLAAAGLLWVVVAEILSGERLLFGVAGGTGPRSDWRASPVDAAADAIAPVISSPALAPALLWAGFAVVLPLLVRGRYLALDLALAVLWVAALIAAQEALGDLLASTTELSRARGGVAGAALGGLVAVAAARARPLRRGETADPALP